MYPSDEVDFSNLDLTPAMSWYSHVVNIMEPEMERGVSYGATYIVEHPCRLATVSVGYADGYARSLSNKGWVLIHGQKAPNCRKSVHGSDDGRHYRYSRCEA